MFIVFTGLDGSGTSTIAKKLSQMDAGSILLKTPSEEYNNREIIDDVVRKYSPLGHFFYYLSSSVYMSDYIKANIDYKNKNVYCVRYLIDTYVSNKVAGIPITFDYNILGNELLKPDLTVYIMADEDVRERRITKRGKSELDRVLDNDKIRKSFLEHFNSALDSKSTYYFDNTGEDIDKEVEKLYQYIKKLNNF